MCQIFSRNHFIKSPCDVLSLMLEDRVWVYTVISQSQVLEVQSRFEIRQSRMMQKMLEAFLTPFQHPTILTLHWLEKSER